MIRLDALPIRMTGRGVNGILCRGPPFRGERAGSAGLFDARLAFCPALVTSSSRRRIRSRAAHSAVLRAPIDRVSTLDLARLPLSRASWLPPGAVVRT